MTISLGYTFVAQPVWVTRSSLYERHVCVIVMKPEHNSCIRSVALVADEVSNPAWPNVP